MSYKPQIKSSEAGQVIDLPLDAETIQGKNIFDSNDIIKSIYLPTLTSAAIIRALGYTPYNSSNPNGYITGITKTMVTTALGYIPGTSNFSGAYTDLTGKPSLAAVATSGSYNDLSDKPTIPVVPTNVSAFTNDAGYLTQHQSLADYATKSYVNNKSYLVTEGDNRTVATKPNDYADNFVFKGLKTNTYIGSPSGDTYSYLFGLRGWSDSSGGNSHEIAFNNSGIYIRNGATTSWGSWAKLATIGDIPSSLPANGGNADYATASTRLYASDSPYRYGDRSPYYAYFTYNALGDNRWYLRVSPSTPAAIRVDYSSDADTVDGLHIHTGRNNEANKVVRTDENGYIQAGYINSSSGDENNYSEPGRIWGTNGSDHYMRSYNAGSIAVGKVVGTYSGDGGQQGPGYYGRNRVGFLMSNQSVNGYTNYTNWLYMDNYSGNDVGGATAIGVARTEPRAFIMQSDYNRSSWNNSAELISTYNISSYALPNAGSNPTLGNGTAPSQPGGEAVVSIRTTNGNSKDCGIFYLSQDNAYICNSSDNAYNFAVFDTDVTTDFSTENSAEFVVCGAGNGCKIRGNTVIHTGNMSHLYRHKIHAKIFSSTWITFDIFNTSATRIEVSTLRDSLDDGYYTVTGSYGRDPITDMQINKDESDYIYISTYNDGESSTRPSYLWDDVSTIF